MARRALGNWTVGSCLPVARTVRALVVVLASAAVMAQSAKAPPYSETVLYAFRGGGDGGYPYAGLVRDAAGNFYGTTYFGKSTVFKLTKTGKETVLYRFSGGKDGGYLTAGVIRDAVGNLYGTAQVGGDLNCDAGYGCGVVFKLDKTHKETVLYAFKGGSDGWFPYAGVVMDEAGTLYGTTYYGGNSGCNGDGCGTVFKLDSTGKETVLHAFTGGADGAHPMGDLLIDAKGTLYGTTYGYNTDSLGTVFAVDTNGNETVLHSFTGTGGDGANPQAGLIMDRTGVLYGTTMNGGLGAGTVFALRPNGKETILYDFLGGYDGAYPEAGLIRDGKGNLYGTTYQGGVLNSGGTVFKLEKTGAEIVLRRFSDGLDGGHPIAPVVRDAKGNIYGTTEIGGPNNWGVVFKLIPP